MSGKETKEFLVDQRSSKEKENSVSELRGRFTFGITWGGVSRWLKAQSCAGSWLERKSWLGPEWPAILTPGLGLPPTRLKAPKQSQRGSMVLGQMRKYWAFESANGYTVDRHKPLTLYIDVRRDFTIQIGDSPKYNICFTKQFRNERLVERFINKAS